MDSPAQGVTWSVMLLLSFVMTHAQSPPSPTWPRTVLHRDGQTTVATNETGRSVDGWPWWWWIPVAGGAAVIFVIVTSLCICCCCRRYYRNKTKTGSSQGDETELQNAHNFRRMNSSAAKRYFLNVVSVFSWGSDFGDYDMTARRVPEQNGSGNNRVISHHEYMNPDDLDIPDRAVPPRPPKGNQGQHYLNVNNASVSRTN